MWDAVGGLVPVPGRRTRPKRDVSVWWRVGLGIQVLGLLALVIVGWALDGPPVIFGNDARGALAVFGGLLGAEWARAWGARDW